MFIAMQRSQETVIACYKINLYSVHLAHYLNSINLKTKETYFSLSQNGPLYSYPVFTFTYDIQNIHYVASLKRKEYDVFKLS